MRAVWMVAAGVGVAALASGARAGEDAVARGEKIALIHCSRCHVIPGKRNFGIGNTPSFKIMVQSENFDWRRRFQIFYTLRPHPNFIRIKELPKATEYPAFVAPVTMSLADMPDLMAYVDKLAETYRK